MATLPMIPETVDERRTSVTVCRGIAIRNSLVIEGRRYITAEGWMSIAVAHGCVASSEEVQRVEGGWTAIAVLRRIEDGTVIARAEGFLGDDEPKWAKRPVYASRAMAQKRAVVRVCRAAFSHVLTLMREGQQSES